MGVKFILKNILNLFSIIFLTESHPLKMEINPLSDNHLSLLKSANLTQKRNFLTKSSPLIVFVIFEYL